MPKKPSTNKRAKEMWSYITQAEDAVNLAKIYLEDGAFATAALNLRNAAECLDRANGIKQSEFSQR